MRSAALVLLLAARAAADTPVTRPEATDLDRDTTPPGRVEFGFDGGAPVGAYAFGVQLGYLEHPLRLHTVEVRTFPVEHRETLFLGGALALGDSVVVDARMPLSHQVGPRMTELGDDRPLDHWVPGDLALGARLRVVDRGGFSAFFRARLTLGTGDDGDFAGEEHWTAAWMLIGRADVGHGLVIAATGGIHLRDAEVQIADRLLGDELVYAAGAAYALPPIAGLWCEPDQLRVTAEVDGILGDRVGGQRGPSPVEARIGVVGKPRSDLAIGVHVGLGLDDQIGAPLVRAMLEVAWQAPAPPPQPPGPPPELDTDDDDR